MEVAESGLRKHLEGVDFSAPRFPVVSNVTAEPVSEADEARLLLVAQLTSPVRWAASMRTMRDRGVTTLFELGPGKVLSGLMRRIDRDAEVESLGTAEQLTRFLEG
jgi:[acyl-carrier-protein] S-malonyltransferase